MIFISQLGKPTCWKFPTSHANDTPGASCWNKPISSTKHSCVLVSAPANLNKSSFILLQTADFLSVMLKLCEIHQPQMMTEQRDINCPIRIETVTLIKSLMRYEVDSQREVAFPSSFRPLPGVLQITMPRSQCACQWLAAAHVFT